MNFKEYIKEYINEIEEKNLIEKQILALSYLSNQPDLFTENSENLEDLEEGVKEVLGKFGLKIHKGDGIIDYIKQFSKGAGKLIIAAIQKDTEKVKEIASTMDKAKVVDFLLKLDMATMHIITGPIHFVDAITGWDLMANLKHAGKTAKTKLQTVWKAIEDLKTNVHDIIDEPNIKVIRNNLDNIEQSIPKV